MTILGLTIPLGGPPSLLTDHCPTLPAPVKSAGDMTVSRGVWAEPSEVASPLDADAPAAEDDHVGAAKVQASKAAEDAAPATGEDDAAPPAGEPAADDAAAAEDTAVPGDSGADDLEDTAPPPADDTLEISGRSVPITLAQSEEEGCPTLTAPETTRRNRTFTVDAAGFSPPSGTAPQALTETIGGNPRGSAGRSVCAEGDLTGVRADVVHPEWLVETDGVVGRVAGVCGEVTSSFIGTATHPEAARYSTCPSDDVVIGLEGHEGDLVNGLTVRCQGLDEFGRPAGDVTLGDYVGGSGGLPAEPVDCPPGMRATGLHGLAENESGLLTSVGLACAGVAGTPTDIVVEICRDSRCDWWATEAPYRVISAEEQAAGVTSGQVDIDVPFSDWATGQPIPLGDYVLRAIAADGSLATTTISVGVPDLNIGLTSALDMRDEMVRPAGFVEMFGDFFDPGVELEALAECYPNEATETYPSTSQMVTSGPDGRVEVKLRMPSDVPPWSDCSFYLRNALAREFISANDWFLVREPDPQVQATPIPAVEGSTFVVSGTDFAPEADVEVTFMVCEVCPAMPPVSTTSDVDGSFATAPIEAPGGSPGIYATATTVYGDEARVAIPIESLPPALEIPEAARSGSQLTVAGRSFPILLGETPLADVDLAVDCGDAVVRPRAGRIYDKKMSLNARQFRDAVLDVPETDAETCQVVASAPLSSLPAIGDEIGEVLGDPIGDGFGEEIMIAAVQAAETVVLASSPLAVTQGDPQLIIDPPTVAPSHDVTVTGVDFVPGEVVTLTYQWPAGPETVQVTADSTGGFMHTTTAPADSVGQVTVTAVGDRGSDVTGGVSVQNPQSIVEVPPPPPPPPPPPASPPASPAPAPPPAPPTTIPTAAPTSVTTTPPTAPPTAPPVLPAEPTIVDPREPRVPGPPIDLPSDRPLIDHVPAVEGVVNNGDSNESGTTDQSTEPPADGEIVLPPPGGTDPGDSGDPGEALAAEGSQTQDEEAAAGKRVRSRFTQALPLPSTDLLNTELLRQNALIALLLILLMLFSGELFNATYEEHAEEVNGWFGPISAAAQRFAAAFSGPAARVGGIIAFLAVTGVIGSLLDPEFGFDMASIALVLGITAGLVVITAVYYLAYALYMRRTYGEPVRVRAIPGGILVALACVAISRAVDFEPGYLYGVIAGIAMQRELSLREEGKVVALTALGLLLASVASWLAWGPVVAAASGADPTMGVLVLDATLASVFVAGVEILAFSLLPMRFLDGPKLKAFNPVVWMAFLGVGMFGFVHVLLHPDTGMQGQGSLVLVLALFAGFAVFSTAFWGYFRYRKPRTQPI